MTEFEETKSTRLLTAVIFTASLVLIGWSLARLHSRPGPHFDRPRTLMDYVNIYTRDIADAIVAMQSAEPLLPHGATVTCFRPVHGGIPSDLQDLQHLVAVGQLPRQKVFSPSGAVIGLSGRPNAEWVIALRDPLTTPWYQEVAVVDGGRLYRWRQ